MSARKPRSLSSSGPGAGAGAGAGAGTEVTSRAPSGKSTTGVKDEKSTRQILCAIYPRGTFANVSHDISKSDRVSCDEKQVSSLYGELTYEGSEAASEIMQTAQATVMVDIGSGHGKHVMQSFLNYPNLTKVIGVEFTRHRHQHACQALKKFAEMNR